MIKLKKISTKPPKKVDKKELKEKTKNYVDRLGELQAVLRAQKKHAVMVIFQGMDASGKDGAVKNVFKDCLHDGVKVYSFKNLLRKSLRMIFYGEYIKKCPGKGEIQIFKPVPL